MLAMQARRRCVRFLTCRCACPQGADEVGKYANEECTSGTQVFCALGGGTPKADACKAGTAAAKAWCGLLIGMNARSCSADADCPQNDEQREHAAASPALAVGMTLQSALTRVKIVVRRTSGESHRRAKMAM